MTKLNDYTNLTDEQLTAKIMAPTDEEQLTAEIVAITVQDECITIGWKWQPEERLLQWSGKPIFHVQVGNCDKD